MTKHTVSLDNVSTSLRTLRNPISYFRVAISIAAVSSVVAAALVALTMVGDAKYPPTVVIAIPLA
jgi:hypothetical protein